MRVELNHIQRKELDRLFAKIADQEIIFDEAIDYLQDIIGMTPEDFSLLSSPEFVPIKTLNHLVHDHWHISRTALSGQEEVATWHSRCRYVVHELRTRYPILLRRCGLTSNKKLWFHVEEETSPFKGLS